MPIVTPGPGLAKIVLTLHGANATGQAASSAWLMVDWRPAHARAGGVMPPNGWRCRHHRPQGPARRPPRATENGGTSAMTRGKSVLNNLSQPLSAALEPMVRGQREEMQRHPLNGMHEWRLREEEWSNGAAIGQRTCLEVDAASCVGSKGCLSAVLRG